MGADRIIKMLDATPDGHLGVEAKGIYTIEDFLVARRLMYWQVYLHKTVVAAEEMLRMAVIRARELLEAGRELWTTHPLRHFLTRRVNEGEMRAEERTLELFCEIDDDDITTSLKAWTQSDDKVLRFLSRGLVCRDLFHIEMSREPISEERIDEERQHAAKALGVSLEDTDYIVRTGQVSSKTYTQGVDRINIIYRDGSVRDISEASDMMRLDTLGAADRRYYICAPRRG